MIRIPTENEKERFAALCEKHSRTEVRGEEFSGIGIYNEKRLHRIIKEFVCEDESCFEVKLGGSVADVFCNGVITEVQTGSFYPLKNKIANYLQNTDHDVRIIHPVICKRKIVRIDPITGEVLYARSSPKKEAPKKILPELVYLSEHLRSCRLRFEIYSVSAEEHRYSDEIHRYRKSGKRDSELFPSSLESITSIECTEDFAELLPEKLLSDSLPFTASQFEKLSGIKGRKAYNALGALCAAGLLQKEKSGKSAAVYRFI